MALGTVLTNRNEVRDERRRRINYGSVCHYSFRQFSIPYTFQIVENQDVQHNVPLLLWM
jgi:hypothetical protein